MFVSDFVMMYFMYTALSIDGLIVMLSMMITWMIIMIVVMMIIVMIKLMQMIDGDR